jgi:hypothetical protein
MDAGRLQLTRVDAVTAGHGVGEHHDLARVGGIGQDLAPTGRGSREDEVALGRHRRPAQTSLENGAALQGQEACHLPRRRKRRRPRGGWRRRIDRGQSAHRLLLSGITVPGLKDGRSLPHAPPAAAHAACAS